MWPFVSTKVIKAARAAESNSAVAAVNSQSAAVDGMNTYNAVRELRLYVFITYVIACAILFVVFRIYRDMPEIPVAE